MGTCRATGAMPGAMPGVMGMGAIIVARGDWCTGEVTDMAVDGPSGDCGTCMGSGCCCMGAAICICGWG